MWLWVSAGSLASIISLICFLGELCATAWGLYGASLILFGVAIWAGAKQKRHSPARQPSPGSKSNGILARVDLWLLVILAVALFLRLYQFPSIPFGTWYDEAVAGIDARRVLQDVSFRPVFWESMNHPAHHLYLFALAMRLLGDNILSLRIVSVFFGMGTVLTAYLFGREYAGRRWGLLLAFMVATMRWDINFSRIAMNSIDVPFFAFLTLYFALRAARSRLWSLTDIAGTGLAMGLGLCFYTGFRLFAIALMLFAAGWLLWHTALRNRTPSFDRSTPILNGLPIKRLLAGIGVFTLTVWIAVMPVVQFALLHQDTFWQRTQTVSIFSNRDEPNLIKAVAKNAQKHLLMFNYRGDNNGRHNLPTAPTLDKLSAVLFALGIGVAFARRDNVGRFFLVLLPFGLAGGIFSLDFEAPQSLRSIASLPAAAYFIGLSMDSLWTEWLWAARIKSPRLSTIPALAILAAITISNGMTYFDRQASDIGVWQAFSATETLVAKDVAASGPEPIYYFSQLFYDHPCIRFHAPAVDPESDRRVLPLPDPLPVRETGERPVVLYIHPDEAWVVEAARQLYPQADVELLPKEPDFPPSVFIVRLSIEDIANVQGLNATYWQGVDRDSPPQSVGHMQTVDTQWPEAAPLPLPFTTQWEGILYAPRYGDYTLQVEAPDTVELALDGEPIGGTRTLSTTQTLAQGNHALRLVAQGGEGPVKLLWQPPAHKTEVIPSSALFRSPVTANGLLGKYYDNADWSGTPIMERIDPRLDIYFHLTPLSRPYSVEWTGQLEIPYGGGYQLGVRAVDIASIFIDGRQVVETEVPDIYVEAPITLDSGFHDMRILFQDLTNRSRIHLYWVLPDGEREIIPSEYLWPNQSVADSQPRTSTTADTDVLSLTMSLEWRATWGKEGAGDGEFREPRDLVVVGDTVYVADTGNQRVSVFDRNGIPQGTWEGGEEPFQDPLALGVDPAGSVLVLDSMPGWIYRFDDQGQSLPRIAGPTTRTFHPRGMSALPDGTIIVADTGGSRILFLDSEGTFTGELGQLGDSVGELNEPTDVLVDPDGALYVLEAYNHRLQKLSRWGSSLGSWSIPPAVAYDGPHAVWAPDGSLLMTAPEDGAILRYSTQGQLLNRWTQAGSTSMQRPVGIFIDGQSKLYVTDTVTHQIYIFSIVLQN